MSKELVKISTPDSKISYRLSCIMMVSAMLMQGTYYTISYILVIMLLMISFVFIREHIKIDTTAILLICMLAIMSISCLFVAENKYVGFTELLKYILFFGSYILFLNVEKKETLKQAFFKAAIGVALIGLLLYYGIFHFEDAVIEKSGRMQSILQYANTTALIMGLGIFMSIDYYKKEHKKKYLIYGSVLLFALFLTKSRAVFALFLGTLFITTFIRMNIAIPLKIYSKSQPQNTIYSSILRLPFVNAKWSCYNKKKCIAVCIILFALAVLVGLEARMIKISVTEPTLIERIITYQDAVQIIKNRALTGIGIGSWQEQQFMYQSAPYAVRYIHNYYLQIGLDGGVPALCLFGLFIIVTIRNSFKDKKTDTVYFSCFVFIALHSMLDVDLNFGIIILLFTLCAAFLNSDCRQKNYEISRKTLRCALVLPMILFLFLFISEYSLHQGNMSRKEYNFESAKKKYRISLAINPFNYKAYYFMALCEENLEEALHTMQKAYEMDSYDYTTLNALIDGYSYKGDYETALFYAEKLLKLYPYNKIHQNKRKELYQAQMEKGQITKEQYKKNIELLEQEIETFNANINTWYRYIDEQMEYDSNMT